MLSNELSYDNVYAAVTEEKIFEDEGGQNQKFHSKIHILIFSGKTNLPLLDGLNIKVVEDMLADILKKIPGFYLS